MKKIAFIVLLFSCSISWAQQFIVTEKPKEGEKKEEKKSVFSEEEYNKLLNYTPKSFIANTKSKPENSVLLGDLNSISSLELRYAYQQQMKLNPSEIKWMEDEINSLATAFFSDGKPTIMKKVGSYETGCQDKGMETEKRNGYTVTILRFCYTCPGSLDIENRFLEIFNSATEKLIASKKLAAVKKTVKKKQYKKKIKAKHIH